MITSTPSQSTNEGPSSSQACNSTLRNNCDTLFEPSVEMLVEDFDDERTLEEEEALAATEAEDPNTELSNLQKESDMPIEELLALYNCAPPADINTQRSSSESDDEHVEDSEQSELMQLYSENCKTNQQIDDEEDDGEYSPDEDEVKKTIMVGGEYQAAIPEGLCQYDDALPYENEDKLLWDPTKLLENDVEDYLNKSNSKNLKEKQTYLRDNEQSLYLLLQCGHNVEEALRRGRLTSAGNSTVNSDGMSLWSEEECRNFENGLRIYGKDFHSIQKSKVRTRSVGEIVQFYYLWKKTERHDVFANKSRLDKKKYNLHPGVTDYMDRFLEEQENGNANVAGIALSSNVASSAPTTENTNTTGGSTNIGNSNQSPGRVRSSSPAVNCLLYSDSFRHHHLLQHHDHIRARNSTTNSSSKENILNKKKISQEPITNTNSNVKINSSNSSDESPTTNIESDLKESEEISTPLASKSNKEDTDDKNNNSNEKNSKSNSNISSNNNSNTSSDNSPIKTLPCESNSDSSKLNFIS